MRIRHILCLSAASTISQLAMAALPPSPALGRWRVRLTFVAKLISSLRRNMRISKSLWSRACPKRKEWRVERQRITKKAYDAVGAALGKVSKNQTVKACTTLLESK